MSESLRGTKQSKSCDSGLPHFIDITFAMTVTVKDPRFYFLSTDQAMTKKVTKVKEVEGVTEVKKVASNIKKKLGTKNQQL